MNLIKTFYDLLENIESVENYLVDGTISEQEYMRSLIRKGKSIIAYKANDEIRFAPSRFLGYLKITVEKHKKNKGIIDGRLTNSAITKALHSRLSSSNELEKKFVEYCSSLGEMPSNYRKRRYWYFELKEDFHENLALDNEFAEGRIIERIHKKRERNQKVVSTAKRIFKEKHTTLFCEACELDFTKIYGKLGNNFIEAHHTIPISSMKEDHKTLPEDIALLCANCHRMIHRKRPWLTVSQLRKVIQKNAKR